MNEFLIYLLGVVIAFIMNVIVFRFTRFTLNKEDIKFMMPILVFTWFMSWLGAATMLLIIIIDIMVHSSILYKLFTKFSNIFIKLTGK